MTDSSPPNTEKLNMENKEKIILVTNDDGIFAAGLHNLVEAVRDLGRVYVVAPDSPQSGKGHAVTLRKPLWFNRVDTFGEIEAWESSGTPVDCVKWAKNVLLKNKTIDLCVSGINHGANYSINIIYSGTMSAAMEAAFEGIHSVGFSLLDFSPDADFTEAKKSAAEISRFVLAQKPDPHQPLLLNVNIPALPAHQIKGTKVCRQAHARWVEEFKEAHDPQGNKYYWLAGEFVNLDRGQDTDVKALEDGYISVVPCQFDLTRYEAFDQLTELHHEKKKVG